MYCITMYYTSQVKLVSFVYLSVLKLDVGPNSFMHLGRWRIRWTFCFCNISGLFSFTADPNSWQDWLQPSRSASLNGKQYAILNTHIVMSKQRAKLKTNVVNNDLPLRGLTRPSSPVQTNKAQPPTTPAEPMLCSLDQRTTCGSGQYFRVYTFSLKPE